MASEEHLEILRKGAPTWNARRQTSFFLPDLAGAKLSGADLSGANLRGANLIEADLQGSRLAGSDFAGADLSGAVLRRADLKGIDLSFSHLANADLSATYLKNANLRNADLSDSRLLGSNIRGAILENANLSRARLERVDLQGANLRGARLLGASLEGANLRDVFFSETVLTKARFAASNLMNTHFLGLDLRGITGLEQAIHQGPSPIDTQSLAMSLGLAPTEFLKGCGLQDWEILAAKFHNPKLRPDEAIDISYEISNIRASSPIVPLSIFLSYTHSDQDFIEVLERRFDQDGIRSWRDLHDLVAGPLDVQVDRAIGLQRATLLVLSERSVESDWVQWEAERARIAEKRLKKDTGEHQYLLCPVALDDAWKDCDWPGWLRSQIQRYVVLDLSDWEDDTIFETQYAKLKQGLGIYYRK